MKKKTILLKYIAGYIDGDGCFYIGKTIQKPKMITVYEYSIQIVSVKREILDTFCHTYGGFILKKPNKINHKDQYCWIIKGQHAAKLSSAIKNYLVDKKIACTCFIKYAKTIVHNKFCKISQKTIDKRENLIIEIRKDRHMNNLIDKESINTINKRQHMVTPEESDYPYLAGLIDSEGCFRVKKWKPKNKPNHVYMINLEIGNTKLPIMPWLIERFGGTAQFSPCKGTKKASATWCIAAKTLSKILPKIRPFLTNKRDVCDKLIEFQKTILPNGGDRHSEIFKALFEKRIEVRERIIDEIHKLNHKGPRS